MATHHFCRSVRASGLSVLCAWSALFAITLAASQPVLAAASKAVAPAAGTVLASCSWDRPGHNPFKGDVVAAVDRYSDIPPAVRSRLKQRMALRDYDEIADIKRDQITGKHRYDSDIRDMHFGPGSICRTVTRAGWTPQMQERGLVFCESGHCILVPTVCRNVSRIVRRDAPTAAAGSQAPAAAGPSELLFAPPGAGGGGTPSSGPAIGGGGSGAMGAGTESFASLSAIAVPSLLLAGGAAAAGHGAQRSFGVAREDDAAVPGDRTLPEVVVPELLTRVPSDLPAGPPLSLPPTAPVPEPATVLLFGAGLAALAALRRRGQKLRLAAQLPTDR